MILLLGRLVFLVAATASLHWLAVWAGLAHNIAAVLSSLMPELTVPGDIFVWGACAIAALVILLLWILLRLTDRIADFLSPRTDAGAIIFDALSVSALDAQASGYLDVAITASLRNGKAVAMKYRGQISAAANGGTFASQEEIVRGTIPPLGKLSLVVRIAGLPGNAAGGAILHGVFKYDIRYAQTGGLRKRRSHRAIAFEMPMPRQVGDQPRETLRTIIVSETDE